MRVSAACASLRQNRKAVLLRYQKETELPDLAVGLIACVGSGMASQAALVMESLTELVPL